MRYASYKDYRRLTDQEMIEAYNRRDHGAMIESITPLIIRIVNWFARPRTDLNDELLSEAFLIVVRSLQTFDPSKAKLTTYATGLLPKSLAHYRRRYLQQKERFHGGETFLNEACDYRRNQEREFDSADFVQSRLQQLQPLLTKTEFSDLCEVVLNGKSQAEIAKERGAHRAAVNESIRRVRKKIKAAGV